MAVCDVAGESTRDIIDLDKAQFKLEIQDRKYGQVSNQKRCNTKGKYNMGVSSVNLLMDVSGDNAEPFLYHRFHMDGTDRLIEILHLHEVDRIADCELCREVVLLHNGQTNPPQTCNDHHDDHESWSLYFIPSIVLVV